MGTFVHSRSRAELEYLHETAVCVDEKGVIVKIDKEHAGDVKSLVDSLGWSVEDVEVQRCQEGQFFFPGFIGKFTRWTLCFHPSCFESLG